MSDNDEIAEKIDELADLCANWTSMRQFDARPHTMQDIVMTCQDVAALVRVTEVGR